MRYIGNKTKLLDFIEDIIDKHNIEGKVFADLFAGTGTVGDYFKGRFKVVSNDFMYYSFVFNKAKLSNGIMPQFSLFESKYKTNVFDWLNSRNYIPNKHFFIYNNYTPIGGRKFFTEENGLLIDGIRITIEELYRDKVVTENEYYFLIASLLESITRVSNTSGTYEAFFKFWESRATKTLKIEPLEKFSHAVNFDNELHHCDSNELIRQISGDILYIDPPYSVTQYASAYHILETVARYDLPNIKGVGGKRDKGKCVSLYSRKQHALKQFEDLFRQAEFKHILVSYSNQSIVPLEQLVKLAENFAADGRVWVENLPYKEYQNHRSSNKRNGNELKEVLIYFKKDNDFNKSPLNYSGSKDTLVPKITKHLPKHVGTFVDVLGGAFNVGANICALDKVVYNEINPTIHDIIKWILENEKSAIISEVENVIKQFGLVKRGRENYLRLRDYYNEREKKSVYLFVLHLYAFQNMIRFNSFKKFNTPIGVAGYSDDLKRRIRNFKSKSKVVEFINGSYTKLKWTDFPDDTVFYFDPPYFITSAAYNDGKRGMEGWNGDAEIELLSILTEIHKLGYKFLLSNVVSHRGKDNHLLVEWIEEHNFKVFDMGTTGWRYAKNEVLIRNYDIT